MPVSLTPTTHLETPMTTLHLPTHVHFECEADTVVFMDLKRDQYSMLVGPQAHLFQQILSTTVGLNRRLIHINAPTDYNHTDPALSQLIADLLENGILSTVVEDQTSSDFAPIPIPEMELINSVTDAPVRPTPPELYAFFASCVTAKRRLSRKSIEYNVRTIQSRQHHRRSDTPLDLRTARKLVRIYNRLRPLIPYNYLCMFDSLSLLEFLSKFDCYPSWIFAVQLEPWAAHCWVQYNTTIFNETVDNARTYLPLFST